MGVKNYRDLIVWQKATEMVLVREHALPCLLGTQYGVQSSREISVMLSSLRKSLKSRLEEQ